MADVRIVAKALEDFGDDWHWVVLHEAEPRGARAYWATTVDTVCGIALAEGGVVVTLHDTGAPEQPDCVRCLDAGVSPGLRLALDQALAASRGLPASR